MNIIVGMKIGMRQVCTSHPNIQLKNSNILYTYTHTQLK